MTAIQKTKQLLEDRRDWILFIQWIGKNSNFSTKRRIAHMLSHRTPIRLSRFDRSEWSFSQLRSINGAKFQVVILLQQTPQTCKFLGFHRGEVGMPVLLRYGVMSLNDWCPTFPDSRVDSSHSTLEDETTMPFWKTGRHSPSDTQWYPKGKETYINPPPQYTHTQMHV